MTIAELHGKLAPDRPMGATERMEDLLTSDVFGTMKYAGWDKGFMDWLLKAEPAPIKPSPPPISNYISKANIIHVEYSFWPRLNNNREPDLALLVCFESGDSLLILIEAKYFSGTSDWEENDETNVMGLTGNQIADQVNGMKDMSTKDVLEWFKMPSGIQGPNNNDNIERIHLFITMHSVMPVKDYELSANKINNDWPVNCYWLSWNSLAACIKKYLDKYDVGLNALLLDLLSLLKRKGLVPFSGFNMNALGLNLESPFFWNDNYWNFEIIQTKEYCPFWGEDKR